MPTRLLRITGIVQGVGYRYAFDREARLLGVTGWVRNRADSSVEALIHGPERALESLTAWARRGPSGARVDGVAASAAAEQDFAAFEIRPTV